MGRRSPYPASGQRFAWENCATPTPSIQAFEFRELWLSPLEFRAIVAETRNLCSQSDGDIKHVIDLHPAFARRYQLGSPCPTLEEVCKGVS